jgi:hypothetical protein
MEKKIVHPILFSIFFVLFFYSLNGWLFTAWGFVVTVAVTIIYSLLLFITLGFFFGIDRGSLITSLFLILFFSYGPLFEQLNSPRLLNLIGVIRVRYIMLVLVAGFALGVLIIFKKKDIKKLVLMAYMMSIFLIVISLFNIAKNISLFKPSVRSINTARQIASTTPDIYYIVLDAYGSQDTLKSLNFSNDKFYSYLEDNGFYIADESKSNYSWTVLSLSSSLNMRYVGEFADVYGESTHLKSGASLGLNLIENNVVQKTLKSHGYKYIHFKSVSPIKDNKNADINLSRKSLPTSFLRDFYLTSALSPFNVISQLDPNTIEDVFYTFEALQNLEDTGSPVFVFAHVIIPHTPYILDEDCNRIGNRSGEEGYIAQVKCTNKLVMDAVDAILERSNNPIIIIQGDHGPNIKFFTDSSRESKRMGILNAYRIPDDIGLYPSITPVNTFRYIFNHYFGENNEVLPDESFFSESATPYKFNKL